MQTKVTAYYEAQARHDRQLKKLTSKPLAKWKDKDFEAIEATRRERDTAVAALSVEQKLKHFLNYTPDRIKAHKLEQGAKDFFEAVVEKAVA